MIGKAQKEVLKVHSLSKNFLNVKAVNNISFTVEQGDIFAFLGPNGAGKTTTLRILLDIIKPDNGQIEWNLNSKSDKLHEAELIGYLWMEKYLELP